MDTMSWLEFKELFMRYFCPQSTREACRWQLLHITRGGISVEDYTREFLRLLRHVPDMRDDEQRAVDLFVNGLGSAYSSIHIDGHNLEHVIEEARMLERRHIR